jgi:hypothetical protein
MHVILVLKERDEEKDCTLLTVLVHLFNPVKLTVFFVLSSVTDLFYWSDYVSRQNIRYVVMKMFILSMKFPQHPHKLLCSNVRAS